jgi:hypothetical protein
MSQGVKRLREFSDVSRSSPIDLKELKRMSAFEVAIARTWQLALVGNFLWDIELVALLRANRHTSAVGFSRSAVATLLWWTRYRTQYEMWRDYVRGREIQRQARLEARELSARKRFFGTTSTMCDAAWQWTCDNWLTLGREPHVGWYVQYRSYMIASMGVHTRFAIVDCDRHTVHCWLPYELWQDVEMWQRPHARRDAAQKRLARKERRAQVWVNEHQHIYRNSPSPHTASLSSPSTSVVPSPPATHYLVRYATYLAAEQRSRFRHLPFVYAPHRVHAANANSVRYREAVEYLGLPAKLAEMGQLARAGTAFCVHAVHIYGLEYQLAVADIENAHCDSIRDLHSTFPFSNHHERHSMSLNKHVWSDSRRYVSEFVRPDSASDGDAKTRGDTKQCSVPQDDSVRNADDLAISVPQDDSVRNADDLAISAPQDESSQNTDDLEVEIVRLRRHFVRQYDRNYIPFRRRDCIRNVDMADKWGSGSSDWPLSHNLCGRRVSALYLSDLYASSKLDVSISNDDGAGDAAAKRVYVHQNMVVERRRRELDASNMLMVGMAIWQDIRVTHSREAVLAIVAAEDAGENKGYVSEMDHAIFDGLMRAIQTAERDELVSRVDSSFDKARVRRYSYLHSVLLPITIVADNRVWLPFDTLSVPRACKLCHKNIVFAEIGTDNPRLNQTEPYYCGACAQKYWHQAPLQPTWGGAENIRRDTSWRTISSTPLQSIREQEAIRAIHHNWCAPFRDTDVIVAAAGVYGCNPKSITFGTWRGLIVLGAD